ncbi:hypothetical protein FHS20_004086 [Phyllobacterium endophyticum]|nr:hypothetical protein [Phyllobacterium endophyticum]
MNPICSAQPNLLNGLPSDCGARSRSSRPCYGAPFALLKGKTPVNASVLR